MSKQVKNVRIVHMELKLIHLGIKNALVAVKALRIMQKEGITKIFVKNASQAHKMISYVVGNVNHAKLVHNVNQED